jgi:DNA-binding NtrC family response regulator
VSTLSFPRFLRFSPEYRQQEPIAAKICRSYCAPAKPEKPKLILFLDDNATLREMLIEHALKDYAAEFVGVGTVNEARAQILAGGIDAALLDIRLGDGNGIELYEELASRHPEMEVVFLTAWADTTHRELIAQIGPARVFPKDRLADAQFMERLLAQLRVPKKQAAAYGM